MEKYVQTPRIPRSKVVEYWYSSVKNYFAYFIDIGEPNCWACGRPVSVRFDNKNIKASAEECFQIWDKVGHLQVCHIIPRSLGGKDEYSNLFLMCKECHELAPDTIYPDIFFEWVDKQQYINRDLERIKVALKEYGLDEDDKLLATLESDDFKEFCKDKVGLHRTIFGGSKIKHSSMIGLLKKYKTIE